MTNILVVCLVWCNDEVDLEIPADWLPPAWPAQRARSTSSISLFPLCFDYNSSWFTFKLVFCREVTRFLNFLFSFSRRSVYKLLKIESMYASVCVVLFIVLSFRNITIFHFPLTEYMFEYREFSAMFKRELDLWWSVPTLEQGTTIESREFQVAAHSPMLM